MQRQLFRLKSFKYNKFYMQTHGVPVVQVTSMHFTVYTAQNCVGSVCKNMSHCQGSHKWIPVFRPKIVTILPASITFAYSPAHDLLGYKLFHLIYLCKSTVHANPVLINLNIHYLLWMQVVRQRGYAVSSIFLVPFDHG